MKPEEAIIRLRGFRNWLLNEFQKDAYLKAVIGMSSQIKDRVQNKGLDKDGGLFTPYSTKPWFATEKSFVSGGWSKLQSLNTKEIKGEGSKEKKKAIKARKSLPLPGGYKQARELDGMKTDKKYFSRQGFMWRDFGVKKVEKNKITLGGKTEDGQDKIDWNSHREKKKIIEPSQEEIKFLTKQVNDAILQALLATGIFKKK